MSNKERPVNLPVQWFSVLVYAHPDCISICINITMVSSPSPQAVVKNNKNFPPSVSNSVRLIQFEVFGRFIWSPGAITSSWAWPGEWQTVNMTKHDLVLEMSHTDFNQQRWLFNKVESDATERTSLCFNWEIPGGRNDWNSSTLKPETSDTTGLWGQCGTETWNIVWRKASVFSAVT